MKIYNNVGMENCESSMIQNFGKDFFDSVLK